MLFKSYGDELQDPSYGVKPAELYTAGVFDRDQFRKEVTNCRACSRADVLQAPRFGTGRVGARLFLVGQNPPQAPERCLHGAWMVHYKGEEYSKKRGPHELLVLELLEYLKLTPDDVYATNAVKCPTSDNKLPHYWRCSFSCSQRFLQHELAAVRPTAILAFGHLTHRLVADCFDAMKSRSEHGHYYAECDKFLNVPNRYPVAAYANVVEAPHVSLVNRFVKKDSWLSHIAAAIEAAATKPQLKTVSER